MQVWELIQALSECRACAEVVGGQGDELHSSLIDVDDGGEVVNLQFDEPEDD